MAHPAERDLAVLRLFFALRTAIKGAPAGFVETTLQPCDSCGEPLLPSAGHDQCEPTELDRDNAHSTWAVVYAGVLVHVESEYDPRDRTFEVWSDDTEAPEAERSAATDYVRSWLQGRLER